MKTPTKYTHDHLQKLLISHGSPSIFHCTRLSNLPNILKQGCLFSVGTLWGIEPSIRLNAAFNGGKSKYDKAAEQGFIDYIFFTSFNRISSGCNVSPIYGHIALEFDSTIILNREHFFFPFNSGFDWERRGDQLKYSDLNTLNLMLKNPDPSQEILLRRAVPFARKLKKIHAFNQKKDEVLDILGKFREDVGNVTPEFHNEGGSMIPHQTLVKLDNIRFATINGKHYDANFIFQIKDENEVVYLLDEETNCITKFSKIGDDLFYEEDKSRPVGNLTKRT